MWHRLYRLFSPVLILASTAGPAWAQEAQQEGSKTAALPYAFAFLATLLVLVILCSPSRKR